MIGVYIDVYKRQVQDLQQQLTVQIKNLLEQSLKHLPVIQTSWYLSMQRTVIS